MHSYIACMHLRMHIQHTHICTIMLRTCVPIDSKSFILHYHKSVFSYLVVTIHLGVETGHAFDQCVCTWCVQYKQTVCAYASSWRRCLHVHCLVEAGKLCSAAPLLPPLVYSYVTVHLLAVHLQRVLYTTGATTTALKLKQSD